MTIHRSARQGFSLLEVILALAILTMSLLVLVQSQAGAVLMTQEAERVIVATDLAKLKMSEALLRLEEAGIQTTEVVESGEFDDLGDELTNLEFGRQFQDYHWEYTITEIDIQLAGDLMGMMGELGGEEGGLGEMFGGAGGAAPDLGGASGGAMAGLAAAGMSPDMLTQMIGPYIRMVVVRVWWGEDSETAKEQGTEVTVATHVANPAGMLQANPMPGGLPQ